MSNIDFYIVSETPITECYRFICRLIDKAYMQKHQVFVLTNSTEETTVINKLLWMFKDDAFIPHNILEKNAPADVPVQIGFNIIPKHHKDILLNLTPNIPEYFSQFNRVLEIVPNNDAARKISRQKFKAYREKNCELTTHNLTKNN